MVTFNVNANICVTHVQHHIIHASNLLYVQGFENGVFLINYGTLEIVDITSMLELFIVEFLTNRDLGRFTRPHGFGDTPDLDRH